MENCPLHCVNVACSKPGWLQENETFILTTVASLSAALGVIFSYFLKSRCVSIKCCCLHCIRQPPDDTPQPTSTVSEPPETNTDDLP